MRARTSRNPSQPGQTSPRYVNTPTSQSRTGDDPGSGRKKYVLGLELAAGLGLSFDVGACWDAGLEWRPEYRAAGPTGNSNQPRAIAGLEPICNYDNPEASQPSVS